MKTFQDFIQASNAKYWAEDQLCELAYKGNVGMQEMMLFYQKATPEQKRKMEELAKANKQDQAFDLLAQVTGVRLMR